MPTLYRAGAYDPAENEFYDDVPSEEEGDAYRAAAKAQKARPTFRVFIQKSYDEGKTWFNF